MRALVLITILATLTSGCSVVRNSMYKTTGDVMVGFAGEHQVPYVMTTDDPGMNCGMAEALTPMLMSFSRVRPMPDQLGIMVMSSSGLCAQAAAMNEELRYLRAIRAQDAVSAEDALIAQKRLHIVAAERNYKAYKHMLEVYGEPGGKKCPTLSSEFDQMTYMMGLLSGLQALSNEISSTAGLGVPKNIAAKVERSTRCLDDDQWWGLPSAVQALIWKMLPGAEPEGESAELRMKQAVAKGEKAGVRLPHVMQAIGYLNDGDTEGMKEVIRQHVKSKARRPSSEEFRLMDVMATEMLTALSDRMWTEATGHRTPVGALGTFWDDRSEEPTETIDLEDIL